LKILTPSARAGRLCISQAMAIGANQRAHPTGPNALSSATLNESTEQRMTPKVRLHVPCIVQLVDNSHTSPRGVVTRLPASAIEVEEIMSRRSSREGIMHAEIKARTQIQALARGYLVRGILKNVQRIATADAKALGPRQVVSVAYSKKRIRTKSMETLSASSEHVSEEACEASTSECEVKLSVPLHEADDLDEEPNEPNEWLESHLTMSRSNSSLHRRRKSKGASRARGKNAKRKE